MGHASKQNFSWLVAAASSEAYAQFPMQYQRLRLDLLSHPESVLDQTSGEIAGETAKHHVFKQGFHAGFGGESLPHRLFLI